MAHPTLRLHGVLLSVVAALCGCRGKPARLRSVPTPTTAPARTADDSAERDRVLLTLGYEQGWANLKRNDVRRRVRPLREAHGYKHPEVERLHTIEGELIEYYDLSLGRIVAVMLERRGDPGQALQDAVRPTRDWPKASRERINEALAEFMASREESRADYWVHFENVLHVVAEEFRKHTQE